MYCFIFYGLNAIPNVEAFSPRPLILFWYQSETAEYKITLILCCNIYYFFLPPQGFFLSLFI